MYAPDFWQKDGLVARLLTPASWAWQAGGCWREATTTAWHPGCPVFCVGNFTVGGAGKTPTALALYDILAELGVTPHFLSRGYGGRLAGPHRVDLQSDAASDVGDEPLLLARRGTAWISRDRADGARQAKAAGAQAIIMDDGLQNPSLIKDFSLAVIDGANGIGNGRVMPAGPLREPLSRGISRIKAAIIIGKDETDIRSKLPKDLPVFTARITVKNANDVAGKKAIAFAGIGRPAKFYHSLAQCGATIVAKRDFADHHAYDEAEIADLWRLAEKENAVLVTTEKDLVRLPSRLQNGITTLQIGLIFDDRDGIKQLVETVLPHGA